MLKYAIIIRINILQNFEEEGIFLKKENVALVMLTLGLGTVLGSLNVTMFNIALPSMVTYFDTTLSTVQWLTSGYLLAAGIIIPTSGYLGDHFGYKRVFCTALIFVLLLSIIGPFAWSIEVLIVIRILFGLTAGMLAPLSLAMMYKLLPASQQTKGASIWGMANMVGGIIPSVLSGVILSVATWHFLMLFNIPFAVLAVIFALKFLAADEPINNTGEKKKLDFAGFALTTISSMALLFAFSNISNWGFTPKLWICLAIGVIFLLVYIVRSWDKDDVLLNLQVFRHKRYAPSFIASCVNSVAIYMVSFLMPLLFQSGLGVSPLITGFIILPCSVVSMFMMPVASSLYPKLGEKVLSAGAVIVLIIGSIPFLFVNPTTSALFLAVAMCVRSIGMGTLNLVATNAPMSSIPPELSGHASSLTNWCHQMLNALIVGLASSLIDLRVNDLPEQTTEGIALAYTSTANLIMAISCTLLLVVLFLSVKYFRTKEEMRQQTM